MGTSVVKIFDKYFQDQFDMSMNRYEGIRKTNTQTLALFEDFAKNDTNENKN